MKSDKRGSGSSVGGCEGGGCRPGEEREERPHLPRRNAAEGSWGSEGGGGVGGVVRVRSHHLTVANGDRMTGGHHCFIVIMCRFFFFNLSFVDEFGAGASELDPVRIFPPTWLRLPSPAGSEAGFHGVDP